MESKLYHFYATAISGLEEVVLDELRACLPGLEQVKLERGRRHGRIFFVYARSPRHLLELRAPLNLFALLAEVRQVTVGRPGMERLAARLEQVELQPALRLLRACGAQVDPKRFQLSTTLQGAHRFARAELAGRVQGLLAQGHGLEPGGSRGVLRFHLQVEGNRALFGLQLAPSRSHLLLERGGLSGPLAWCMARLLPAAGREALVALGCSPAGVEEIARACSPGRLVACAAERQRGPAGDWLVAQAGALPLRAACVELVLAAAVSSLEELARILKPGGVAALLVAEPRAFAAAAREVGAFGVAARLPINIKGRRHLLLLLERLAERDEEPLLQIERG